MYDSLTGLILPCNDSLTGLIVPCNDSLTGLILPCNDSLTGLIVPCNDSLTGLIVPCNDSLTGLIVPQHKILSSVRTLNFGLSRGVMKDFFFVALQTKEQCKLETFGCVARQATGQSNLLC